MFRMNSHCIHGDKIKPIFKIFKEIATCNVLNNRYTVDTLYTQE